MFSGGIDSTGVLHHLLTNEKYDDHQLLVHHIHLQNRQNRAKAEADAVNGIVDYYKKNSSREFIITTSVFNSTGFAPLNSERFPYDADVIAFYAANITVARKDIQNVAVGRTKTDIESGGDYNDRMQRRQDIFSAVWKLEEEKEPSFFYPIIDMTKEQVYYSLPKEVQRMVWWCRVPVYKGQAYRPCGRCTTCLQVKEFIYGSN